MSEPDLKRYEHGLQQSPQWNSESVSTSIPNSDVLARRNDYAEYCEVFRGRSMPFAFVDLDLLAQNISEVAKRAEGKTVRLASKSLRSVAIIRRILAANPIFQGIMCYSAQEAAYLASQGFDNLLVGYPCWQEQDITTVALAVSGGAHITLMIDSLEHIERIEGIASQQNARIPVCLEIDMSLDVPGLHFGVWRSPIRTAEQARPLIERLLTASHVYLDGIMGYEAQIAGVGDNFAGQAVKNRMVRLLKRHSEDEVAERRATIVSLARSLGVDLRFVNGGGTGSIETTKQEAVVTEITVGSAFYAPALFDNYRDFRYQPAAAFAIEIVRQPRPGVYTCLGGGYIASGSVGKEKQPQPYLPRGAQLVPLEGAGEVQTPIRYDGPELLKIGDPIFLRHSKAGELCERFTHLLLVSQGTIVDEVTTYRGDGRCFI